jgi:hypothetical protein
VAIQPWADWLRVYVSILNWPDLVSIPLVSNVGISKIILQ